MSEAEPLFPFQIEGAEWMHRKPFALLADEMGLGKTVQAIRAADKTRCQTIVVVCPAVGRPMWADQFEKWSEKPRKVQQIMTGVDVFDPDADVYVLSFDLVEKHYDHLMTLYLGILIIDEAHFLKTRTAKRTRCIYGDATLEGIKARARYVWALSGTPAPNNAAELYPLMRAFGIWKQDYWSFLNTFCIWYDTPFGVKIKKHKDSHLLRKMLDPIMLRRKKDEVMKDLPPIHFSTEIIPAGYVDDEIYFFGDDGCRDPKLQEKLSHQQAIYNMLVNEAGKGARVDDHLRVLDASKASISTIRKWNGMQKIDAVYELACNALDTNEINKLVIFAIHRDVLMELHRRLKKKYPTVLLFGGTPPEKRGTLVKKFQENHHCRVFLGQVVAAGTTITLTAARDVWFVEASWVPSENAQAAMRCHRIGQRKSVFVKFFALENSLDQKVIDVLRRKTKDLAEIFG